MSEHTLQVVRREWLTEPLPDDVAQSLERLARADDVRHIAVMPDVHLSGEVCVGVAVATESLIYPAAVGSDIGCGMAAIQFAADADLLRNEKAAGQLLHGLYRAIPSLKHAQATAPRALPDELAARPLSAPRLEKVKQRDGLWQYGTLGRGNHFLEFQADDEDRLWLMIHSGSRAMGQAISGHHFKFSSPAPAKRLLGLDASTAEGAAYLADHDWAIEYAAQNRLRMVERIAECLERLFQVAALPDTLIHCNHNHVRRETHGGQTYWVHRKGALSAALDEPGLIPGSMGTASFHVAGRGLADALGSSSHGAGRAMARGVASRSISVGRLQREMRGVWFDQRISPRLRDEAPSAYKDIHGVMRAQRDLTCVVRQLRPLLSYKGV